MTAQVFYVYFVFHFNHFKINCFIEYVYCFEGQFNDEDCKLKWAYYCTYTMYMYIFIIMYVRLAYNVR